MEYKRGRISKNNIDRCDGNLYNRVTKVRKISRENRQEIELMGEI